jgi:hypothetical protein
MGSPDEHRKHGGTFEISALAGLCEQSEPSQSGIGYRTGACSPVSDLATHIWKDTKPVTGRGSREGIREQQSTSPRNSHAGSLVRGLSNMKVTPEK